LIIAKSYKYFKENEKEYSSIFFIAAILAIDLVQAEKWRWYRGNRRKRRYRGGRSFRRRRKSAFIFEKKLRRFERNVLRELRQVLKEEQIKEIIEKNGIGIFSLKTSQEILNDYYA